MQRRRIVPPPEHIYPPDPWRIVETRFAPDHVDRAETIFALANGYLGVRGTFDEGRPSLFPGTFVNGFHETWQIVHAEDAYGLARTGQTIVNAPDATVTQVYVDDEPLLLSVARLDEYERVLDMANGTLTRELVWTTPSGKHVRVRSRRIVSFESRHTLAIQFEVEMLDHPAPVVISSQIIDRQDEALIEGVEERMDPRLAKQFTHRVLEPKVVTDGGDRILLGYQTANSGMTLGVGVDHVLETENTHRSDSTVDGDRSELVVTVDARPGVPITLTKSVVYHSSRSTPAGELVERCGWTLDRLAADGFEALVAQQREHLDRFWERSDVEVDTSEPYGVRLQQAVRWNLFQLAQASWRAEGAGIPAKGLTGQAYEGHYFWDTEVYVIPFLAYTHPRIARNLLRFRYSMLDQARGRADVVSQRGALFPWRTINGEEASAYYQAGTAQYHINADIAYAIRKYIDVRGDVGFLREVAEILVETARLWADLGFYGEDGRFHIHGVTGPDEYTTVVNDNTFTNLMARLNLNYAASSMRRMQQEMPEEYGAVVAEVGLHLDEIEAWEHAAATMYVAYDDERAINPQDDSFLDREVWDLDGTPEQEFPLLLHFHPLVIYRYQVLKQADIVLAMLLLGNEFTRDQKRANFDYYDPLTTGDSSLSASVQSIIAAEIGNEEKALEYFTYALLMDLGDVAGNASDGVHIASTGGVWMSLVFGFAGVRDFDGVLTFHPHLPDVWERLEFPLRFRDRRLRICLTHAEERYELVDGDPLDVTVRGTVHTVSVDTPLVITDPAA